jgi:ribosomal protein S27AE
MPAKRETTAVQSHTEYTRTRSRCPRCGNIVPAETAGRRLCGDCTGATP